MFTLVERENLPIEYGYGTLDDETGIKKKGSSHARELPRKPTLSKYDLRMWMGLFADVALRGAALYLTFLPAGKEFCLFIRVGQVGNAAHVFSVILGDRFAIVESIAEHLCKAAASIRSRTFRKYRIQARDRARADNEIFP